MYRELAAIAAGASQPAHIHEGQCGPTLGKVVYPPTNVVNGTSTTTIDATMAQRELAGRPLDPNRIAVLREEGAITVDAGGRLRVTQAGFPVLDAVVADLAA